MFYYSIYNLNIASQLEIYEAVASDSEQKDVLIEVGQLPESVKEQISQGKQDYLSEQIMWFYLEGLVVYYIENGNHIIIHIIDKSMSLQNIRSYLLGSAFSLLLMQRGYIVMHGSSLLLREKGIVITGCSGAGKSTLAIGLRERGGAIFVSDDISALQITNQSVLALPSIPQQKLCRSALTRFAIDERRLSYIDENRDKFAIQLEQGYLNEKISIQSIFQLSIGSTLEIHELYGKEKVKLILSNLYRGEAYQRSGLWKRKLNSFIAMASLVRVYRIIRPEKEESLERLINIIEEKV